MPTSTQLTSLVNQQADPMHTTFKMWCKTRYLVAQNPAATDYSETKPGYFRGKLVIPGPKYNPKLSEGLSNRGLTVNDFQILMNVHHIRFIDNRTTADADESVGRALYTIMSNEEADHYEKELTKYYAHKRKAVSS